MQISPLQTSGLLTSGLLVLVSSALSSDLTSTEDDFSRHVFPVLEEHCIDCHSQPDAEGELDLESFTDAASALAQPEIWQRVTRVLSKGEMPPAKTRQRPAETEVNAVLSWIEDRYVSGQLLRPIKTPGRTTLRRLNRQEYQHAILDLLGVDYPTLELLPADGVAHGFDVIGDVLSMPPLLFEKYFEAAEQIARAALPTRGEEAYPVQHFDADEMQLSQPEFLHKGSNSVHLFTNGTAGARVAVDRSGEYILRALTGAQQAGPDLARLRFAVDQLVLDPIEVEASMQEPAVHDVRVRLEIGSHLISASFINDYYNPNASDHKRRDRNLMIAWLELVGPVDVSRVTPFQAMYQGAGQQEWDVRQVLLHLAQNLWRGPVEPQTIDALLQIAEASGASSKDGDETIRCALTTLLVSPRFLFRVEPEPSSEWRELGAHELATRLAAFLWSSVPDEELLELAGTGELLKPTVLAVQVDRLLTDARASRLSRAFAGQWLQLGRMDQASPDPGRFPSFDFELRDAMRRESELFFDAILRENRRVSELLSADFTFVNERLARHYGLNGVRGQGMQRVPLPAHLRDRRCGLLGQGAVLLCTSNPARTSPVKRGKWILESLLATPPPPPPPGVDQLDESQRASSAASIRERLAIHRDNPACATCHDAMDGLGLALENFDAVGVWRDTDGDFAIDASAELPGGIRFEGPAGLRDSLLQDQAFLRGLLSHLVTYALGRGLVEADEEALEALLAELPKDPALRQVMHAVVRLDAFQRRYSEPKAQ
jgi:hypothetical protein